MKPVLFPQTLIAPELAQAMQARFGPVTIFHPLDGVVDDPMATLAQTQQIELICPCPDDSAPLGAAIEAFKRWAAEHAGQDLVGLMRQNPTIPFFDPETAARIAAEVKSGAGGATTAAASERLYRARLLLLMAEEFDCRQRELATDFMRLEVQERRMIEMLKGETSGDADAGQTRLSPPSTDAPLHMLAARLGAWAQLALQTQGFWQANPHVLFLTANLDVLDHIADQHADAEPLLNCHRVKSASDALCAWLSDPQGQPPAAESSATTSMSAPINLTLLRLPGWAPSEWIRRLAGEPISASASAGVLVGHIALA